MFGMGMGEIIIIAIVALLALGPDKLPEAAKKIGETIRGLRQQTTQLRKTIEDDTQLGDAMREIRSALSEDPTKPSKKKTPPKTKPAGRRPAEGPPPEEAPPTETLVKPAEGAVSRDSDISDAFAAEDSVAAEDSMATANGAAATADEVAQSGDVAKDAPPSSPSGNGSSAPAPARELTDYEKYIHNNGTEAAAEKFGTSVEHAEAAMLASLDRG